VTVAERPPRPAVVAELARRRGFRRCPPGGGRTSGGGRRAAHGLGRWLRCEARQRRASKPRQRATVRPTTHSRDPLSTGGLRAFGCDGCSILNRSHGSRDRTPLRPHRPRGRGRRARCGVTVRRAARRDPRRPERDRRASASSGITGPASGRPLWKALRVADHTRLLSLEAAAFVDAQLAPFAHGCSWAQVDRLVEEALVRFDPEAAEERRREAQKHRHVDLGLDNICYDGIAHGTTSLDHLQAHADAGVTCPCNLAPCAEDITGSRPPVAPPTGCSGPAPTSGPSRRGPTWSTPPAPTP
jgi:hypothetical protein